MVTVTVILSNSVHQCMLRFKEYTNFSRMQIDSLNCSELISTNKKKMSASGGGGGGGGEWAKLINTVHIDAATCTIRRLSQGLHSLFALSGTYRLE